jgi:hypothetical protein
LAVEQPVPRISVSFSPLQQVFRHPARGWPSQGDTISLISVYDAARGCAGRPSCSRAPAGVGEAPHSLSPSVHSHRLIITPFQYLRGSCSRRKQDAQHVTLPRVSLPFQQSFPPPLCIDKEVTVEPPCTTPQRLPREVYPWHLVGSRAPAVFQLFSRRSNRGVNETRGKPRCHASYYKGNNFLLTRVARGHRIAGRQPEGGSIR